MAEPTLFAECRFCQGDGNPSIHKTEDRFYVQCQRCASTGPYAETIEQAIKVWLAVHGDDEPKTTKAGHRRYMLFVKGFKHGASMTAVAHEDEPDYMDGYAEGRHARAVACDAFCTKIGHRRSILRLTD